MQDVLSATQHIISVCLQVDTYRVLMVSAMETVLSIIEVFFWQNTSTRIVGLGCLGNRSQASYA